MSEPLSAHQRDILRIFAGLKAAPGQLVPVATLWLNWRLSGTAFADAVESLAERGLLAADLAAAPPTRYALTCAGLDALGGSGARR